MFVGTDQHDMGVSKDQSIRLSIQYLHEGELPRERHTMYNQIVKS